jgi:hypothetical protein
MSDDDIGRTAAQVMIWSFAMAIVGVVLVNVL